MFMLCKTFISLEMSGFCSQHIGAFSHNLVRWQFRNWILACYFDRATPAEFIDNLKLRSFNPIPTGMCHMITIFGLIQPSDGRNRVNAKIRQERPIISPIKPKFDNVFLSIYLFDTSYECQIVFLLICRTGTTDRTISGSQFVQTHTFSKSLLSNFSLTEEIWACLVFSQLYNGKGFHQTIFC